MSLAVRGFFWVGLYLAVAVAPLLFALVARFKTVAAPFGMDAVLQFHRQVSYVALAFILTHPLLLILADPGALALLNPLTAPWQARLGLLAVAVVALSVWRKRLRISYEVWQLTHGVLAVVVVAAALTHVGLVGYYVGTLWKQALWLVMSVAFVGLLAWVRVLKPLGLYRRPWRLEEVVSERGNTWTMVLRPEGHAGLRFEGPGFVLIGGGVDVTPLMSMLRTLADRGDARPCHLFLGNRDWEDITFREEIGTLQEKLDLKVVHVLLAPEEDWEGERGFIDENLLRRHLPERHGRLQYFVCGPGPMMDAMEDALSGLGVPAERVHTERFDLV